MVLLGSIFLRLSLPLPFTGNHIANSANSDTKAQHLPLPLFHFKNLEIRKFYSQKNPVKRLPILSIQNILEYDSLAMLKPYIYPNHPRIQKTFYLFLLDPREICIDARKITIWWQAFVDKQLVPNASRTAIAGTTAPALSTTATPTFATTAIPALTSDRDDASAGEKQRGICKRHRKST